MVTTRIDWNAGDSALHLFMANATVSLVFNVIIIGMLIYLVFGRVK